MQNGWALDTIRTAKREMYRTIFSPLENLCLIRKICTFILEFEELKEFGMASKAEGILSTGLNGILVNTKREI